MMVNQATEAHLGDCRSIESVPTPAQVDVAVFDYKMLVFKSFLEKVAGSAEIATANPSSPSSIPSTALRRSKRIQGGDAQESRVPLPTHVAAAYNSCSKKVKPKLGPCFCFP